MAEQVPSTSRDAGSSAVVSGTAPALRAGVATRDITPDGETLMSGFAMRAGPSEGVHDPLSVRALVVQGTALVTVDVVALHEDLCARVRKAAEPWVDHVVVHATHTHSGPASSPGRLGGAVDPEWLQSVEHACTAAIAEAARAREPVLITAGYGDDPQVARNRRRPDAPVDPSLPVVRIERTDGRPLALVVSYACHPVVLGAENRLLSADYPGVVRDRLEADTGATVLFATSCAGDVNTGHPVDADSAVPDTGSRTFEHCALVGRRVADAALRATLHTAEPHIAARTTTVTLQFVPPTASELERDMALWAEHAVDAPPEHRALYDIWARWAEQTRPSENAEWAARVTVYRWGPAVVIALPGEPFNLASREIRRRVEESTGAHAVLVLGYSDGCPGYLPSEGEYPLGGYEVTEAHRYYGMPGPFAAGSLERLIDSVALLSRKIPVASRDGGDDSLPAVIAP